MTVYDRPFVFECSHRDNLVQQTEMKGYTQLACDSVLTLQIGWVYLCLFTCWDILC